MPGLAAAYAFSEGSGTTTTDSSGNGNGGELTNATWTTGKFGNALSFNGTSALVTVPDSPSLDLTTGMTLEAWVSPNAGDAWADVIYKGQNDTYYLAGSAPEGPPGAGGTFSAQPVLGTSALPRNAWSHLAATYDGQTLTLYVNGTQVASRLGETPIATSSGALTLGGDFLYGQWFDGKIDEVRIYNVALTASQIQTDMTTPVDSGSDSIPPTVTMTSPSSGTPASHVVPLSAAASDNVGVRGVTFKMDGATLGEDVTAPYTFDWDSTAASNGNHTLTATARDAAGNQTTSAGVSVTASNPVFVNEPVVPGITAATTMAFLPDGRMLVGELTEKIWVVQPGATAPDSTPFLQLNNTSQLVGSKA